MQSRFGDQSVVILLPESSRALKCTCQYTHCLELCSAVTNAIFVNGEGLDEELVSSFLEATLVGDLPAGDEQPKAEFRGCWVDAGIELNECLVEETVEVRGLSGPIVFEVFARLVLAGKFEQCGNEGRGGVLDSFIAGFVGFARLL